MDALITAIMYNTHENIRKKLWSDAFAAVAGAFNCNSASVAIKWADEGLKEFDKRFPAPPKEVDTAKVAARLKELEKRSDEIRLEHED